MLVILVVFILVLVLYYNNRRLKSKQENELLKQQFDQALTKVQLEVHEQTMRQISQEIHDNVGQILTLVNLNLKTLKEGEAEKLATTSSLVNKAIEDLRSLSKSLNPENVLKLGLTQIVKNELDQLERTGQFITTLKNDGQINLSSDRLLILYRMIQEVINNIVKHSGATHINANITSDAVIIQDNGFGFDPSKVEQGLGLGNLRYRGMMINADVSINSAKGRGTIVTFKLN